MTMYLNFSRLISNSLLVSGMLFCVVSTFSCREVSDTTELPTPQDGTVQVPLTIGFEEEADGYTTTRTTDTQLNLHAFDAQLTPGAQTRTAALQPDALYELHIMQYDASDNLIGSVQYTSGGTVLGTRLTIALTPKEDCQLLIVARGKGNTTPAVGGSLANMRTLSFPQSVFDAIPVTGATQEQMNKMPYVLHLPHIKVMADVANAGKGIIQSTENGTNDVRLRLKRLVTQVTLNWNLSAEMQSQGYELKEVKLCQIPKLYSLFPTREQTQWGTTYPSTVSEFVDTYRLTGTDLTNANGSKTVWIPANVRGTSAAASAPIHRTKANAPTAASYAEIVVDNETKKERLYYRAYLGSTDPTDFNLNENTDYNWTLNIKSANYTTDPRIELLDQTPVESENLVLTANCLMLQPGGNLCFNPYQHASGTSGWNDQLVNSPGASPTVKSAIASVKVLWQTKDAGTSGDLVLGYVIDDTNHKNLVNITDPGDLNNARVSVKAPLTQGGNAVIAAYAADGTTILWSWHVWVTDYVPVRINSYSEYATAQTVTRNGTVHKYDSPLFGVGGVYEKMVMMDRDLGAKKGGFPGFTVGANFTTQDVVNTYGLLYQWGRKDPFPTSADGTTSEKDLLYDGYGVATSIGRARGVVSIATAIQHPNTFYHGSNEWCTPAIGTRWNSGSTGYAPGIKTIYDPCPEGWKIPMAFIASNTTLTPDNINRNSIFTDFGKLADGSYAYNSNPGSKQYSKFLFYNNGAWVGATTIPDDSNPKGGRLFLTGNTTIESADTRNSVWIPANVERNAGSSGNLTFAGRLGHMWTADWFKGSLTSNIGGGFLGYFDSFIQVNSYNPAYGWPVRCMQDN